MSTNNITLTFPDGNTRNYARGITAMDVARSLSKSLSKKVLAAKIDGIPSWKTYLLIIIPMMRPVFVTTLVLITSGIVKVYDLVVAQTSRSWNCFRSAC